MLNKIYDKEANLQNRLEEKYNRKKTFDREIELCRMLTRENKGGCGWGKCKDCGVIPLLIKLHKGELLEEKKISKAPRLNI
jgi:hypothetical protein